MACSQSTVVNPGGREREKKKWKTSRRKGVLSSSPPGCAAADLPLRYCYYSVIYLLSRVALRCVCASDRQCAMVYRERRPWGLVIWRSDTTAVPWGEARVVVIKMKTWNKIYYTAWATLLPVSSTVLKAWSNNKERASAHGRRCNALWGLTVSRSAASLILAHFSDKNERS